MGASFDRVRSALGAPRMKELGLIVANEGICTALRLVTRPELERVAEAERHYHRGFPPDALLFYTAKSARLYNLAKWPRRLAALRNPCFITTFPSALGLPEFSDAPSRFDERAMDCIFDRAKEIVERPAYIWTEVNGHGALHLHAIAEMPNGKLPGVDTLLPTGSGVLTLVEPLGEGGLEAVAWYRYKPPLPVWPRFEGLYAVGKALNQMVGRRRLPKAARPFGLTEALDVLPSDAGAAARANITSNTAQAQSAGQQLEVSVLTTKHLSDKSPFGP
jgi:hypothetical protein